MASCSSHLFERGSNILIIEAFSDALAAAAPGGLEHDRVANFKAAFQRLIQVVNARLRDNHPRKLRIAKYD